VLRALPVILEIALLIFALVDCIQAPEGSVRNLPKVAWIIIILLFPIVGSIVYLLVGRPLVGGAPHRVPWPSTQTAGFPEYERPPRGPDDDPEFLAGLQSSDAKHEQMLRDWEKQLREREQRLGPDGDVQDDEPKA
jgi:hypothetical protein